MSDRACFRSSALLGLALFIALRLLRATWRVRVLGQPPREGTAALVAFWHGDIVALCGLPLRALRDVLVLVSRSRDGDLAASVARRMGLGCQRGSSSRGAVPAALGLVRHLRAGGHGAVAADGPRGPRHQLRSRLSALACHAGADGAIPLAAWTSRALTLRSWDGLMLPAPFARVCIVWGRPADGDLQLGLAGARAAARKGGGAGEEVRLVGERVWTR